MKRFLFFNLFLCLCVILFAQSKLSPGTRHLVHSVKQSEAKDENTDNVLRSSIIRTIDNTKYVNAYIHLSDDKELFAKLEELGVKVNSRFPGIITAMIPVERLEEISRLDEIKYIQVGSPVRNLMDKARVTTMADQVQSGTGLSGAFWGTGVVIGVIDTGFEYGHPNFYNFEKTDLRIKRVWDQNGTKGVPPTGFSYGTEYNTKDAILNAKFDNTGTHGTHVTGIAAGADTTDNVFYGMAGDAEIVLVSMNTSNQDPDNINISDGLKYIYDYATSVGKPCVINMSLGMHIGPHDGTSTFDVLADQMQGKGKLLVGACGNEGSDNFHISKTFSDVSQDSLSTFISFTSGARQSSIDIWGDKDMKYEITAFIYDRSNKTVSKYLGTLDASSANGNEQFYKLRSSTDGAQGNIAIATEISPLNGKPNTGIFIQLSSIQNYIAIGFTIKALTPGTVHAWTEDIYSEFTNNNINGFTKGNSEYSVGEIGGTGKRIISVGAYTSKSKFEDFNGVNHTTSQSLDNIASFSSLGPTADGRVKPDITAPGSSIGSSISSNYYALKSQAIVNKKNWNNKTYYYAMMDGTSMASPCVAGILATWLQANNELTPEDIRSILKKTSIQDSHTGTLPEEGDNTWGHGKINAYAGIKESLWLNPAGIIPETLPSILVNSNGKGELNLLFTGVSTSTNVSVFDVNGKMIYRQQIGQTNAGDELPVTIGNISPGIYIVKVASDQAALTSKIVIR